MGKHFDVFCLFLDRWGFGLRLELLVPSRENADCLWEDFEKTCTILSVWAYENGSSLKFWKTRALTFMSTIVGGYLFNILNIETLPFFFQFNRTLKVSALFISLL